MDDQVESAKDTLAERMAKRVDKDKYQKFMAGFSGGGQKAEEESPLIAALKARMGVAR